MARLILIGGICLFIGGILLALATLAVLDIYWSTAVTTLVKRGWSDRLVFARISAVGLGLCWGIGSVAAVWWARLGSRPFRAVIRAALFVVGLKVLYVPLTAGLIVAAPAQPLGFVWILIWLAVVVAPAIVSGCVIYRQAVGSGAWVG